MLNKNTDTDWLQAQWKTALVCGAGGFIGSHVVQRLLSRGWRVIAFDDLSVCHSWNRLQAHAPSLAFITGDLLDRDLLCIVCEGVDTIVHCAGVELAWPATALQDLIAVAVTGTLNLVDAACACGCRRLIRVGAVLPADANHDIPIHAAHRLAESMVAESCRQANLRYLTLRTPEVYGPLQQAIHPSITPIASLLRDLRGGLAPLICGDPAAARDWLHVADLIDTVERACLVEIGSHRSLEIGTGQIVSITGILEHLRSRGIKGIDRFRRSPQRPVFAANPLVTDAQRVLSFHPRRSIINSLDAALPSLILKP